MASGSAKSEFTYEPLTKPTFTRVLKIIENVNNKPLRCELEIVDLDTSAYEAPKYAALSYSWGYPGDRVPMICNGKLLQITPKLDEALRNTHVHNSADYTWVDQIRLMTAIFQLAWIVIAWLGPSNDTTHLAIEQVEKVANTWRTEHSGDPDLEYIASFDPSFLSQGKSELSSVSLYTSYENDADAWLALSRFFDQPWFERVWIVQEMMNTMTYGATRTIEAVAVCGEHQIPWNIVFHAACWIHHARCLGFAPPIHSDRIIDGVEFAASLVGQGVCIRTGYPSTVGGEIRSIGLYAWGVLNTFQNFRARKATDPRDNIFAISGLTDFSQSTTIPGVQSAELIRSPMIPVDYSLSVQDTFRDFARAVMYWYADSYMDSMPPLDLCENDSRGPLDILLDANIPESDTNWPSWVPDWRLPKSHNLPLSSASKRGSMYESPQFHDHWDPNCLSVGGVIIGQVYWVNHQEHSSEILLDSDPRDLARLIEDRLGSSYQHGLGNRRAEILAKHNGTGPIVRRLSDRQESTATAFLWTLTAGFLPHIFREAGVSMEMYERENILYKFLDLLRAHIGKGDVLSLDDKEWEFCKPLKDVFNRRSLAIFDSQSRAELCCRRIFTTNTGYIGTADPHTQPGDYVALLLGMSMPVILRPFANDDGKLIERLIGDAWVRGGYGW